MESETLEHTSEPTWSKDYINTKDVAYWIPNIDDKITPEIRRFLEDYSHIPASEVTRHVYAIREQAWAIRSYPCTGIGIWLIPMLPKSPIYNTVLQMLKAGATLMDIGCFVGHDLRRLVADGAPSHKMYAVDIVSHWEVGYDLFRDKDRIGVKFIEEDLLRPNEELRALEGGIDIIVATHLLHQWDWNGQIAAAKSICKLTRPGTLVVGFQIGCPDTTVEEANAEPKDKREGNWFGQSPETFAAMWDVVGQATGTEWSTQAELWTYEKTGWNPKDTAYLGERTGVLQFVVTRRK